MSTFKNILFLGELKNPIQFNNTAFVFLPLLCFFSHLQVHKHLFVVLIRLLTHSISFSVLNHVAPCVSLSVLHILGESAVLYRKAGTDLTIKCDVASPRDDVEWKFKDDRIARIFNGRRFRGIVFSVFHHHLQTFFSLGYC